MYGTRITAAIVLFFLTLTLSAQKRSKQTVVLNNGSRLTGTVMADSSHYLKLRITTPQVLTLEKSDIALIKPDPYIEKPGADRHGYSIRLSASVLTGRNHDGNVRDIGFHLSNGYQLRNGICAGLGAGLEKFDAVSVMPVYADLRYYPLKSRLSPFIWVKSGFSFTYDDPDDSQNYYYGYYSESKGGFMFNPGAGIELASWRRNAVNMGVGYRYQKITFRQVNRWNREVINELVSGINRIEVQFALVFR